MADGLRKNSRLMAAGIGAGIGSFVTSGITEFARFDDSMREVFSIMPGISKQAMDRMKDDVLGVSSEYGILTDELVPALGTAIGSGIPEGNVMDFLRVAAKAAKAGAADAETSVKALSASINAFQIPVEDADKVANAFFNAIDKGVTTFPELAGTMSQVAPQAAALGLSLEDVLAAVTAMTLQGTPTTQAVTAVNASLTALQRTTPEMTAALKNLGFETGQAALEALGYQGLMEALRGQAEELGVPLIRLTGRLEGQSAILQLTGDNAQRANDILGTFGDTTGKVDAAFETMEGGIGGAGRRIVATIRNIGIGIGSELAAFGPLFIAFGPQITRWIGIGLGGLGGLLVDQLARALPGIRGAGRVAGLAYGAAFVAAAAVIAIELEMLLATLKGIEEAQATIDENERKRNERQFGLQELRAHLAGLRREREAILKGERGPGMDVAFSFDLGGARSEMDSQIRQTEMAIRVANSDLRAKTNSLWRETGEEAGESLAEGVAEGAKGAGGIRLPIGAMLGKAHEQISAIVGSVPKWRQLDSAITSVAVGGIKDLKEGARTADETWKNLIKTGDRNKEAIRELNQEIGRWERRYRRAIRNNDSEAAAFAAEQLTRLTGERDSRQEVVDQVNAQRRALNRLPEKTTTTVTANTSQVESAIERVKTRLTSLATGETVIRIGGQVYGGVGGRASGGSVRADRPYIVGEVGREVFVPRTDGYVFSNHDSRGMGGPTFNVENHGMPMRAKTPRELVQELRRAARLGILPGTERPGWER